MSMHHAYVYEGSQDLLESLAESARANFNFKKDNDPDVQVLSFEKFGIDEAHGLKTATSFKTVSGRALYVVGIGSMTSESQQALLKLFEEPQPGVTFVLLVPHGTLIVTLRSRVIEYPHEIASPKKSPQLVKKFLSETSKARSLAITALLKDEEGVRERVRDFLDGLESELYGRLSNTKESAQVREGLEDIAKVRSYASDRSPSLKMLMEHLALSLPKI